MKERPILFSSEMVRAILDGRKTQTRRVVRPQPPEEFGFAICDPHGLCCWSADAEEGGDCFPSDNPMRCPYGQPGDRLWVRETWGYGEPREVNPGTIIATAVYRADPDATPNNGWKPSIHMPRWAGRITLGIIAVRVERVSDISTEDAFDEGILQGAGARGRFRELWDSINSERGYPWESNPWVWVVEFRVIVP